MTESGDHFTILLQTTRSTTLSGQSTANILYGIGKGDFVTNQSSAVQEKPEDVFPYPTSKSWSLNVSTLSSSMTCKLESGVLGIPNAEYSISLEDKSNDVRVYLRMKDKRGMVMEGTSRNFNTEGTDSIEFAMPSLSILEGSKITMKGKTASLSSGSIWLDRQTLGLSNPASCWLTAPTDEAKAEKSNPLYTGNWFAITMKDGTQYVMAFFWPKKQNQWIIGSQLNPPVYPLSKMCLEYPNLEGWHKSSAVVGVKVLESSEFELNILTPQDPRSSPLNYWYSNASKQTYCSAWHLRIYDETYEIKVFVPGSEVYLGTYFFEGAANVTNKSGESVGKAFCEQMGYN